MHTLVLTDEQLNTVFLALIELPFKQVEGVIASINSQLQNAAAKSEEQAKAALEAAGDDL